MRCLKIVDGGLLSVRAYLHQSAPLGGLDGVSLPFFTNIATRTKNIYRMPMLRFLDILLSGLALIALSLVFLPVCLLLRLTGEGEIFYAAAHWTQC